MTMEAKNILFKTIFILCIVPENVIVYITTLNLTFSGQHLTSYYVCKELCIYTIPH